MKVKFTDGMIPTWHKVIGVTIGIISGFIPYLNTINCVIAPVSMGVSEYFTRKLIRE